MYRIASVGLVGLVLLSSPASALCTSYPNTLANGTTADGGQVMANFNCAALTSGATLNGVTLTGTSSFPGSTTVSSTGAVGIGMAPTNILDIAQNQNAASSVKILNNSSGSSASVRALISNGTNTLALGQFGQSYSSSGIYQAGGSYVEGSTSLTLDGYSGPLVFATVHTEQGRIDASGRFLWGTTSPAISGVKAEFDSSGNNVGFYMSGNVNAAAAYFRVDYTTPQFIDFLYGASTQVGSIATNGSTTSYNTTSDERLKNWMVPQNSYKEKIRSIWVGNFVWKSNGNPDFGIRAQQAYSIFPIAVRKPAREADIWQADYSKLAPLALWGVKDLYRGADARDQRITSLESEMKRLRQANADAATQVEVLMNRVATLERLSTAKTASR